MRVGLIDVDSHNFPNLCLMKLSEYHTRHGDRVEWWDPAKQYDLVYKSRVFTDTYSKDTIQVSNADMEIGDHTGSIQELINLTENLDCYDVYPDIHDHDDLGRYYIEELDAMQVPEHLRNYIDYEAYGRDIALEESGQFTDLGYVRDTGDSFHEYYDGERGSIPEEYRVMTFQDDIPE